MMRVRVIGACGAHASTQRYFSGLFATTLPLLCAKASEKPKYYNPRTWPKHWAASDIQKFLERHLLDSTDPPNYEALKVFLSGPGPTDMRNLELLVRNKIKPPQGSHVDAEVYLSQHLDPKTKADGAAMPLQERTPQLDTVDNWLQTTAGSEKRQVALCYSPQGSGKSQFVKWFVHEKRLEAMRCGRVIVRCCDVAAQTEPHAPWLTHVLQDSNKHQRHSKAQNLTDKGLCELIREHVESVTGCHQDPFKYSDPQNAYKTWISETEWHFGVGNDKKQNMDPLIILDSCEVLAEHEHYFRVHTAGKKTSKQTPYTLLEAFCLAVPSPYSGLFIGCNAKFDASFSLTLANVKPFGPLLPLTRGGFKNAIEKSWKRSVDENLLIPLHDVCGGQPRFLRLALEPRPTSLGSANAFSQCFETLKAAVKPRHSASKDKWFPYAYTCLLASSTKAQVAGSDVIPVNPAWADDAVKPRTYDEAMIYSIGTHDAITQRFMVPPITFVATKSDVPIPPSELHPFLKPEVGKLFRHADVLERDRQFEKPFMYAVYARYLLEYWKDTSKPWVSLAKVFEGAVQTEQLTVIKRYEVNLSKGFKSMKSNEGQTYEDAVQNVVTYLGGTAHHDAYIWCRQEPKEARKKTKRGKQATFAVPLQIRFGNAKALKDLKKQLLQSKSTKEEVPLLLSVNQEKRPLPKVHSDKIVMINADAMSTISWLRWI